MTLRRRGRQHAAELVPRGFARIVAFLERRGIWPQRAVINAAERANTTSDGMRFRVLHEPMPIPPAEIELTDDHASWSASYREMHATWGAGHTTTAGIVTAHDVRFSMPLSMHQWRRRVIGEGLLGMDVLRNPKYVVALATMAVLGATELTEGVLLSLPWNHNLFHWLIEMLPRLQLVDEVPELQQLPLLVPASAPAFVRDSLRITGHADRTVHLDDGVYRAGTLHIPTRLAETANVSPLAVAWLDAHFPRAPERGRRLYISRGDAAGRYVTNDDDVSRMLEDELGFETLVMSELSLEDQVRAFREASVVVGAHGAAFSHVAFSPPGATLIEIFQDSHFNHCYCSLAAIRGVHYGFLVARRRGLGMEVDLDALRRVTHRGIARAADDRPSPPRHQLPPPPPPPPPPE